MFLINNNINSMGATNGAETDCLSEQLISLPCVLLLFEFFLLFACFVHSIVGL